MTYQFFFKNFLGWFRPSADTAFDSALGYFGESRMDRLARDLHVSASELHKLTRSGPDAADLLLLRMTALDLDPEEISETGPQTWRALQRVCAICESRTVCARDFTRNPAGSEWKEYCPNTGTLMALDASPWSSRAEC
jgi:hypothetical protein